MEDRVSQYNKPLNRPLVCWIFFIRAMLAFLLILSPQLPTALTQIDNMLRIALAMPIIVMWNPRKYASTHIALSIGDLRLFATISLILACRPAHLLLSDVFIARTIESFALLAILLGPPESADLVGWPSSKRAWAFLWNCAGIVLVIGAALVIRAGILRMHL